ncbi:LicD family protein [Fournierella massiliensis]|nr:LicD family protein [Fournierella massiliensis]MCF2557959.1 LicD family protein [Fournierella massiliensis]
MLFEKIREYFAVLKAQQTILRDMQIRVQDIQDRVYDDLDKNTDAQIRVHDIQDRVYDVLWQQKTSNHQREMMFWEIYKLPGEQLLDTKLRFFHTIPSATGNERKSQLLLATLLKEICQLCEQNELPYWLDFGTLIGAIRHSGFIPWDDDIDIGMMRGDADKLAQLLQQGKNAERYQFRKVFFNQSENGIIQVFQIRYREAPFGTVIPSVDVFFYDYCNRCDADSWKCFQQEKQELVDESELHARTQVPFVFDKQINQECAEIVDKYYQRLKEELQYQDSDAKYIIFGIDNIHYLNYQDEHIFPKEYIFPLKKLEFEGHQYFVPNRYMDYIMPMYGDIFSLPSDMLSHKHIEMKASDEELLNRMYDKVL